MLRYLKLLQLINKGAVTLAKGEANSGGIQGGDNGGRSQGDVPGQDPQDSRYVNPR